MERHNSWEIEPELNAGEEREDNKHESRKEGWDVTATSDDKSLWTTWFWKSEEQGTKWPKCGSQKKKNNNNCNNKSRKKANNLTQVWLGQMAKNLNVIVTCDWNDTQAG